MATGEPHPMHAPTDERSGGPRHAPVVVRRVPPSWTGTVLAAAALIAFGAALASTSDPFGIGRLCGFGSVAAGAWTVVSRFRSPDRFLRLDDWGLGDDDSCPAGIAWTDVERIDSMARTERGHASHFLVLHRADGDPCAVLLDGLELPAAEVERLVESAWGAARSRGGSGPVPRPVVMEARRSGTVAAAGVAASLLVGLLFFAFGGALAVVGVLVAACGTFVAVGRLRSGAPVFVLDETGCEDRRSGIRVAWRDVADAALETRTPRGAGLSTERLELRLVDGATRTFDVSGLDVPPARLLLAALRNRDAARIDGTSPMATP